LFFAQDGYEGNHIPAIGVVLEIRQTGWVKLRWQSGVQVLSRILAAMLSYIT